MAELVHDPKGCRVQAEKYWFEPQNLLTLISLINYISLVSLRAASVTNKRKSQYHSELNTMYSLTFKGNIGDKQSMANVDAP